MNHVAAKNPIFSINCWHSFFQLTLCTVVLRLLRYYRKNSRYPRIDKPNINYIKKTLHNQLWNLHIYSSPEYASCTVAAISALSTVNNITHDDLLTNN